VLVHAGARRGDACPARLASGPAAHRPPRRASVLRLAPPPLDSSSPTLTPNLRCRPAPTAARLRRLFLLLSPGLRVRAHRRRHLRLIPWGEGWPASSTSRPGRSVGSSPPSRGSGILPHRSAPSNPSRWRGCQTQIRGTQSGSGDEPIHPARLLPLCYVL
jgi:hypothetical protein